MSTPAERALAQFQAEASRTTSLLRFGLVALLGVTGALDQTRVEGVGFWVVLAAYGLFAVGWFTRVTRRPVAPTTGLVATTTDLVAITVLALLAGGGGTLPTLAYVVIPVMAAFRYRPALSAAVGVATLASFVLTAAIERPAIEVTTLAAEAAVLTLVAVATFLLSVVLARRATRIRALLADADALTAQALDAEARERRRLAEDLHDHALQTLLVAGQELDELDGAEAADDALRAGIREIREVVFALHPYVLDEAGLVVAVRRVAERAAAQAGFAVTVDGGTLPSGPHDRLLFGVARELLTNVAKHARAAHVTVALHDGPGGRSLEVADDGVGIDPAVLATRLADGHIGLASTRARVEGVGGTFSLDTTGPGTRTVVRVPGPSGPAGTF
ncbi:sensor histidine kinase [Actinomycetospora chiangmaiensis]|uniref:sensor histidine kinase n=1 Tax=Actinomycetospora chiangmaiensis TaxID=402650 RepID=UPI000371E417|nr:ATP-binding protein [Actinomycetospora chiangmaiensis]